nr:TetR/AcrR family transcriptional regulator [uncultured Clostridium sp.]
MKEDLRVVKTKRNIKSVMMELLQKKPVEKITVTELASHAMINKGTFYHHYSDIYDLYQELVSDFIKNSIGSLNYYEEFFTKPESFIHKFLYDFRENDIKKTFPYFNEGTHSLFLPYIVTEILLNSLMSVKCIEDTIENRVKVQCCITAITAATSHFNETHNNIIVHVVSKMIHTTFQLSNGYYI